MDLTWQVAVTGAMIAETSPDSALQCRDISVRYGEVDALISVSVAFAPQLIHAVVGQNGAGKTTFARVAAGIVKPISGALAIGGRELPTGNVSYARAAGVELVHQNFALPPSFTVAEAMEFGAERGRPIFSKRGLASRWKRHIESLGVRARLSDRIRDLPVEAQQSVEIARALVADAKVLILDEPTAVLSPSGTEMLFERLKGLKAEGVTVILILHKIREVLGVADTVTVLRGGRLIEGPIPASATDARRLSASIIGSEAEKGLRAKDEAALVGASIADLRPPPMQRSQAARPRFSRWRASQLAPIRKVLGSKTSASRSRRAKSSGSPASKAMDNARWFVRCPDLLTSGRAVSC